MIGTVLDQLTLITLIILITLTTLTPLITLMILIPCEDDFKVIGALLYL